MQSYSADCGTSNLTAILKLLNSAQEVVIDSSNTAYAVSGTVIKDLSASATPTPPGAGPLSPNGGGIDNSFIVNPSNANASVGDGVTGGTGVFATTIGTTECGQGSTHQGEVWRCEERTLYPAHHSSGKSRITASPLVQHNKRPQITQISQKD